MLKIVINGTGYRNFISATVTASVTALARGFSFVSTANADNNFPVKVGDRVTILADDIEVIDGFIESLEINYNELMHDIRVSGRSFLADFVDSTAPIMEKSGTTLESIASSLLSGLGIDATVDNQAGVIQDFGNDISSAEIGQNALEFLESYSRKRQVLLTSDGGKKMILTRAGSGNAPSALKNVRGAADNNILDANLTIDFSGRFNEYIVKSQLNTSIMDFLGEPKDVSDQEGRAVDRQIRSSRKITFNAEESMESFSASQRAKWERNIRIGRAVVYTAIVAGNSVNGVVWMPNTLIRVIDEYCQIDTSFLIRDVEYNYDLNEGSRTRLTMITANSLSLEMEQTARKANVRKEGDDFLTGMISGIKI